MTSRRAVLRSILAAAALTLVCGGRPADAMAEERIVNGVATHGHPTTGALLYHAGRNAGSAWLLCSGTLIGCNTFLTAGHCVAGDSDPGRYFVFLQHAGVFAVEALLPHDAYRNATFPIADVAVVKLGREVTGIDPTELNLDDPEPFIPHPGMIVGFGQTLGGANNYGIKRAGAVETASCQSATIPHGAGDDELVCWSFTAPLGPPGDDSNTCNGDSGGPLFLDLGAGPVVAGVTSGGTNGSCGTADHSYDANVFAYAPFLVASLGSDSTGSCGPIPAVGGPDVTIVTDTGTLSPAHLADHHTVDVPSQVNVLRFVLNAVDNGTYDADLYVRRGAAPTTKAFDCKADGAGNFGACELLLPEPGPWHVLVQRASGAGAYQLTTSIFGGPAPVCGNGAVETGEDCDGGDDAACAGLCNDLACECPPPSCGNGVAEQGEECDGLDAASCLSSSCTSGCECVAACGDGSCDAGETAFGCPQDCGCGAAGACTFGLAPSECACDAVCAAFGDCCPDACTACAACAPGCGNGVHEIGEACDDGNVSPGDCCGPTCGFEPAASPCDDASACTTADRCDGAGECGGDANLAAACFNAPRAQLKLNDVTGRAQDRVSWTWARGEAVSFEDFGDPSASTAYDLCVFDFVAGNPVVAVSAHLKPNIAWTSAGQKSWSYKNATGVFGGFRKVRLSSGAANKSKLKVKLKGGALVLPAAASQAAYFDVDPELLVQLRSDEGACWESSFSAVHITNDHRFVAKKP